MLADDPYEAFERAIYEAAVVSELWPDVLSRLGEISGTAGGALLCVNERGQHIVGAPVLDRVGRRFLAENWAARNTRGGGVVAKGLVGVHRFVNEDDYFEPGQAETDPMTNELFRAEGFGWAAGFLLSLPHGDTVIMNVEQYYERGPIRGENLACLDSFFPHLARAALLSSSASFERVRTAVQTLAAIGLPAVAVSPSGKVVVANSEFGAVRHIWTTRLGDRLGLHDLAAQAQLGEALASIDQPQAVRSIPVRGEPGGPVIAVLQVIPVRRSANDVFGNSAAIIILSQPAGAGTEAALVQSLFDLTPAELAVAQQVAAGRAVGAIARLSGRSINTVRNQLKSIMSKTGCTRQVDLVLLMQQLSGGIRR